MDNKKILATVTARGGSKRIPKKSIVPVLGKPIMGYVLEAIKKSKYINRVIVDTDNEEMAEVGRKFGAEIPFMRPKELAEDNTPHVPVLQYELDFLKEKEGYVPDAMILVHPTSPLVTAEEIDACIELFFSEDLDSVESVFFIQTVYHAFSQRSIDEKGYTHFIFEKERVGAKKTGIFPKSYGIGNVYCFKPSNLKNFGNIQGLKSKSVIIDRAETVDIDDPIDVDIAETIMKKRLGGLT